MAKGKKAKKSKAKAKPKVKAASKTKKKSIPVKDFDIYDEYAKAKPKTTIKEAALIMKENDCEFVIVVDKDDIPIGMVSAKDIIHDAIADEQFNGLDTPLEAVMSIVPELEEGGTISQAFDLMDDCDTEYIAIIDKKGKLIGCLSLKDIVMADWINEDYSLNLVINNKDGTYDLEVEFH